MIAQFVQRAAALPAKLHVLLKRISSVSFGQIRCDRARRAPYLRGQAKFLLRREFLHDVIQLTTQSAGVFPSLEICKVRDVSARRWRRGVCTVFHFHFSILSHPFNSAMVIAVPPRSSRSWRVCSTRGWAERNSAMPRRRAPVPWPWMMRTLGFPATAASSMN